MAKVLNIGRVLVCANTECYKRYAQLQKKVNKINEYYTKYLKPLKLGVARDGLLMMLANPKAYNTMPNDIEPIVVAPEDVQLIHFNGRRFIINQRKMQTALNKMAGVSDEDELLLH